MTTAKSTAYEIAMQIAAQHGPNPTDQASPITELDWIEMLGALRGELEDMIAGSVVVTRRRDGTTWAAIGDALRVTKQAAQQRFHSR